MQVYRIGFTLPANPTEVISRVVVASSMGAALTALAQQLPNATATEVRLIGSNAIIVP